eukprot:14415743-Alexandrium_andersonii.AAC.1
MEGLRATAAALQAPGFDQPPRELTPARAAAHGCEGSEDLREGFDIYVDPDLDEALRRARASGARAPPRQDPGATEAPAIEPRAPTPTPARG